jgi:hypothetical protein
MEKNIKGNIIKIFNTIPLAIGVIVAVVALTGLGDVNIILAMLGIGLFSGAIGELIND